ncbi:hypothetical protein VTK73DRAFT_631 [Phialemonium thermophilum]|uniref:Uncharacterized protein n=1 Tax=Phialemonium thermophilum TaxID=223376 RepID=A0ABR3VUJ1_9PEZI
MAGPVQLFVLDPVLLCQFSLTPSYLQFSKSIPPGWYLSTEAARYFLPVCRQGNTTSDLKPKVTATPGGKGKGKKKNRSAHHRKSTRREAPQLHHL